MAKKPRIPTLKPTQYPAQNGRTVPEAARREMYEAFRQHADEARQTLYGIMTDTEVDPGHRIAAAREILNRGYGTAPSVEIIEKTLKVDLSFSDARIRQMSNDDLRAALAVMEKLVLQPETAAEDAKVIDHEP